MRRFIYKVLLFAAVILTIYFVPALIIDPYNVFHWRNIVNNGIEPNKNYVKTKYILSVPDKYDGFLFGSSRVGAIHTDKIKGHNVYNMTGAVSTPSENYETLKTMVDNGIKPKLVIVGVDSYSYTEDAKSHDLQQTKSSYEFLRKHPLDFLRLYFNPAVNFKSLGTLFSHGDIPGYESFYTYGWWCDYDTDYGYNWDEATYVIGSDDCMEYELRAIGNIRDLCDEYDIELVVFTNPMYELTYRESLTKDYLIFLEKLAGVTDYYNFSGLNDITLSRDNYVDSSHYNAEVGDLILSVICDGEIYPDLNKEGFGLKISRDNIDSFIKLIKENE